ncbi:DUF3265 domain-containing protein [Vibrio mimicus]|nr:DUF3265 domain-containing protein [Vibrio parahaemolyticus]MBE3928603.1 DUF3265 domain-containing protein [Vibrio parahaemolyticus]MBE4395022.1 DUF3265 domain-containing protein [Vibrio parahaemolyticus]TBT15420.1 DUF3265 domain-containing protein [Vibrio parahaemolyticus]TNX96025.1 DUF3265 domain-containing protein [Vibrio parahaemolyticus]TOH00245.1 DUF3265 domain-containing protein [Vibrio parahaemolyticus]
MHSKGTYSKNTFNKQFKRDSARVAFWVCGGFGVEVLCGNIGIACFTP